MYRLIVTDFGPLSNVDVTINDISVFIGPQASGKSTIAKLIYYFLSVKDDLSQYYVSYITNNKIKRSTVIISDIKKRLRYKFVQLFGTTKHLTDFKIAFYYFVSLCVVCFLQNLQYLTISNLSVLFLLFFEVI